MFIEEIEEAEHRWQWETNKASVSKQLQIIKTSSLHTTMAGWMFFAQYKLSKIVRHILQKAFLKRALQFKIKSL